MTYNIRRLGDEKDQLNLWKHRKSFLISIIKKHNPDILCIQEDHPLQTKTINKELEGYDYYGFYNEDMNKDIYGEANTIFLKNKFELIKKGYFWLTSTPNKRSRLDGQSIYHRTVTFIELKINNEPILVFNTHFDHLSKDIQLKESEVLSSIIKKMNPINYIICGDFNGEGSSSQIKKLKENFSIINENLSKEKSVMDWSEIHPPRNCIDFIFSNLKSKEILMDKSKYQDNNRKKRTASDHFPIICRLEI